MCGAATTLRGKAWDVSAREVRHPTVCLVVSGVLSLVGEVGSEHAGETGVLTSS